MKILFIGKGTPDEILKQLRDLIEKEYGNK
jgi:hypothetical protein